MADRAIAIVMPPAVQTMQAAVQLWIHNGKLRQGYTNFCGSQSMSSFNPANTRESRSLEIVPIFSDKSLLSTGKYLGDISNAFFE